MQSFDDIVRGFVAAIVWAGLTIASGGTLTFLGFTGFSAFVAATVTFATLAFVTRKWLAVDAPGLSEQQSLRATVRAAAVEPRWIIGRARTAGHLVWTNDMTPSNSSWLNGDDIGIAWVLVLSEGRCQGMEEVWVNGSKIIPHRKDRGYHKPGEFFGIRQCHSDGFNFCADRSDAGNSTDLFRCMLMYGGDEFSNSRRHPWFDSDHPLHGCRFPHNYQLVGKTYLVCWAAQYGERGNWIEQGGVTQGPQEVNALIRGIDLPVPIGDGEIVHQWSENAASARHWWMTEQLGIPAEDIDYNSFKAAHDWSDQRIFFPEVQFGTVLANSIIEAEGDSERPETIQRDTLAKWNERYAGQEGNLPNGEKKDQLRYSINGIITGTEIRANPKAVSDAMDVAWVGSVIQNGRKYFMRPGAPRIPAAHITENFVAEQLPVIQVEPALRDKANAADVELLSSEGHDWGSHRLPRIRDEVAIDRDGAEFSRTIGVLRFVAYERTAERLTNITLKQESENRTVSMQLPVFSTTGTTPFAAMVPSDTITLDLPREGLAGVWRVQATEMGENGLINAQFLEEPPNLYDSRFSVPLSEGEDLPLLEPPRMSELFPVQYDKSATAETWLMPWKHNGFNLQWQWERMKGPRLSAGNVDWGFNQGQSEYSPDELVTNPFDTVVLGSGSASVPRVRALFTITSNDRYRTSYVSPPQGNRTYSRTSEAINWWGSRTHLTNPDGFPNGEPFFHIGPMEGDSADGAVFDMASPWNDTLVAVSVRTYTWAGNPRTLLLYYIHNPDFDRNDPRNIGGNPQYNPSYSYPVGVRRTVRFNYFTFFDGHTFVSARPDTDITRRYNDQNVGVWGAYFHSPELYHMFRNLAPGRTVVMGIGAQMTQNVGQAFVPPNPTTLGTSNSLTARQITWPDSETNGIRVSARYVRAREDGSLFPLSLWASEYRGDWIHMDAGVFMAGQTKSPQARLKQKVYVMGRHGLNTLANVPTTGARLRGFRQLGTVQYTGHNPGEIGPVHNTLPYNNPDSWQQAVYESPIENQPTRYPFNITGLTELDGGTLNGRRISWTLRVGEADNENDSLITASV